MSIKGRMGNAVAAAGDGASFKMVTFNAAAIVVDVIRTKGGPKTPKACQNKWAVLQKTFQAIQAIKGRSGWTWSDETGASITPNMEDAWCNFLLVYKDAKPFKNKGWVHLEKMMSLMPATVKGTHVFCLSQGISGLDPFQDDHNSFPPSTFGSQEDPAIDDEETMQPDVPTSTLFIPSTPPQASQKRKCAGSETPAHTVKKTKMSAVDAMAGTSMAGLNTAIVRFGDSMCKALAGDPSEKTPHCHTKGYAYLALDPDDIEFCEMWMEDKVQEAKEAAASS
ncbi:hypothetical protein BYT27DRAFT_7224436 [Phlegmacium glaucopus]|nr:hypothetical protein BYT27DRAFT_7224436 [Phlegmacium glaucopus]